MESSGDPQFELKLNYLQNMRYLSTAVTLYFISVLLFMIFCHFPAIYLLLTAMIGGCSILAMHLNLRAIEDNIGVPRSRYEFFPLATLNGGPTV